MCLLMDTEAVGCTYEDAEVLAKYERLVPDTVGDSAFVAKLMAA
jgi:hypothetical protein